MKLLFDNNISYRIIKLLQPEFSDCIHVSRSGLPIPASDMEIWNYARQSGFTIVTNDEDFVSLESLYGFPPKIIHLRFGNASKEKISEKLKIHVTEIQSFLQSPLFGVLEIY